MEVLGPIFYVAILIFSVVIHEVAHGFAALRFGDETALRMGRLTLNPVSHLDPIGSVIVPLVLAFTNAGFMFGWAKPVPFNPENIRPYRLGTFIVAGAGIFVNLVIALLFGMILRFMPPEMLAPGLSAVFHSIVIINILLAVFNLVPIPPLDGSKMLFAILPGNLSRYEPHIAQFSFIFLLIFIFYFWRYFSPIIEYIYRAIIGA